MSVNPQQPGYARQIGLSDKNRAGIAPDANNRPMICFQGTQKTLNILESLPEASYWLRWDVLALPLSKVNIQVMETVAQVEEATDAYIAERARLLTAPSVYRQLYPQPAPGDYEPRAHQVEAFCTALHSFDQGWRGFGQWSEQGLGKTKWAIDLMRHKVSHCGIVIGQNSTCYQWADELSRVWPEAEPVLLVGQPIPKRIQQIVIVQQQVKLGCSLKPFIFILNWESLARMIGELVKLRPNVTVADEATRMIHRTTQMSRAAFVLAKHSRYRVAMTGTPIGNDPGDLFGLYRFVDENIFGTNFRAYANHYFTYGGLNNQEFNGFHPVRIGEFIGRMYASAYRITKATASDMPEKSYREVRLDMLPLQKKLYQRVADDLYAEWMNESEEKSVLSIPNAMVKMVRLQQITSGYMPINEGTESDEQPRWKPLPSAKLIWLRQYLVDTMAETDAQVIVWTRFVPELDLIRCELADSGLRDHLEVIDGRVAPKRREEIRKRFNNRQDPLRILLIQIQAGAMGLDLPGADTMLFHTIPFSLIQRLQSIDRGHRLGRTRPYEIIDLVCKGSVDNHALTALKRKQEFSDMLLTEGFTGWMDQLTKGDSLT